MVGHTGDAPAANVESKADTLRITMPHNNRMDGDAVNRARYAAR
jgi:hypothetical protein